MGSRAARGPRCAMMAKPIRYSKRKKDFSSSPKRSETLILTSLATIVTHSSSGSSKHTHRPSCKVTLSNEATLAHNMTRRGSNSQATGPRHKIKCGAQPELIINSWNLITVELPILHHSINRDRIRQINQNPILALLVSAHLLRKIVSWVEQPR